LKKILHIIWHSRIAKAIVLVILVLSVSPALIFSGMWIGCRPDGVNAKLAESLEGDFGSELWKKSTDAIKGYPRGEEQTYLTFPEWYIVYSAEEYAASLQKNPPSKFPYFRSVGQYWKSYCNIYAVTRNEYPLNFGYHVILFVIGGSFSAENITKGVYENTVGRVTELLSAKELTDEDRYAQKVAAEYGNFLHTIPWYEFPFREKLKELWSQTDLWGKNPIRKLERKMILSLEYGFKSLYGWIIKGGTKTAYAPAELEIYAVVENLDEKTLEENSQSRMIENIGSDYSIVALPRYEAFTLMVPRLIDSGTRFVEIAGNDDILISVIAQKNWIFDSSDGRELFSMPVLADQNFNRIVVNVPVKNLHKIIDYLNNKNIKLEHIYDY